MPPVPITEAGSRPEGTFSTSSGEEDTESSVQWVQGAKMGAELDGMDSRDLEVKTEFRHSALSLAEYAVLPFKVRDMVEGGEYARDRVDKVPTRLG